VQRLEEHGGVDVDEVGAGLAEAVDDGIFLEIRIYVAPFFDYNSQCTSKAGTSKLSEISKHHSLCGDLVEKVEFEIRFMHKRVKEKNMLLMISKI